MTSVPVRVRFVYDHRWVPRHASAYLDGELDRSGRRRVERHVGECPECRELLSNLRAVIGALATMRDDQPELVAGAVLASIRSRLAEHSQDGP
jgi:anti-sigma factor RsiW